MQTRFLNENDFHDYRQIRLASLRSDPAAFGAAYEEEQAYSDQHFKNRLIHDQTQFIVGSFLDSHLACIAAFKRQAGQKEHHKSELVSVYCLPEYRHQGIARKTIQFCLKQAARLKGVRQIQLAVLSDNFPAIKLYESLGFVKYGTEPDSLFDGQQYFDEDLMILILENR